MQKRDNDIYNLLAAKYGVHKSVVSMICNHPFMFASRRIQDPDDEKTIMFAYLFKLRIRKRFKGNKKKVHDEREQKWIEKNLNKKS